MLKTERKLKQILVSFIENKLEAQVAHLKEQGVMYLIHEDPIKNMHIL